MTLNENVDIRLTPVGFIKSELTEPMSGKDYEGLSPEERKKNVKEKLLKIREMVTEIVIHPELEEILDGIEGFSHILVLYWPHLISDERRVEKKVHPMGRKDIPKQGIFATCSPARPNPILVSAVELVERKGNILKVRGLESLNDSPVLDIKPYNAGYYRIEKPEVPEWMADFHKEYDFV